MALHPEMVEVLVAAANEYVSDAVDMILADHGAQYANTCGVISAALVKVGMCVRYPEILERYTAPESLAVATQSVESAVAYYCQLMTDSVGLSAADLAAWANYNVEAEKDGTGIGFYEAADYACLPAESMLEFTCFLAALRHYRDVWRKRNGVVGMPSAVEATQARWEKMVQDAEAALKLYEDALLSNPNTRPALRFVAANMALLSNLAHMWPEGQPLPWWLNSDQLQSELSEHPAQ